MILHSNGFYYFCLAFKNMAISFLMFLTLFPSPTFMQTAFLPYAVFCSVWDTARKGSYNGQFSKFIGTRLLHSLRHDLQPLLFSPGHVVKTPLSFSSCLQIFSVCFLPVSLGCSWVLLFSALSDAPLLPSVTSHKHAETMLVL